MDSSVNKQPIVKKLKLTIEKLAWLIEAVEGKPSRTPQGALLKGNLLIDMALLIISMENKDDGTN